MPTKYPISRDLANLFLLATERILLELLRRAGSEPQSQKAEKQKAADGFLLSHTRVRSHARELGMELMLPALASSASGHFKRSLHLQLTKFSRFVNDKCDDLPLVFVLGFKCASAMPEPVERTSQSFRLPDYVPN